MIINWTVVSISLLISLFSIPIYTENRSRPHLYIILVLQALVAGWLGWVTPPEITWLMCGALVTSHGSYVWAWLIGSTADYTAKVLIVRQLEGDNGKSP